MSLTDSIVSEEKGEKKAPERRMDTRYLAERGGFEPPKGC
jgi:hypothetical protein